VFLYSGIWILWQTWQHSLTHMYLLLNRNLLPCLDWRINGVKDTFNSKDWIIFNCQVMGWLLHVQLVSLSLTEDDLKPALEMLTRRCPEKVHLMEGSGQIFSLLPMFCEYEHIPLIGVLSLWLPRIWLL